MEADVGNVREHGAVGDGVTVCTTAIQAAVEDGAAAGGGRVLVPAGRYVSGTICLKSNIDLHLTAGATILASLERDE